MLRTNLATRPFYNVRAIRVVLGAATVLVLGFTAFNLWQIRQLSASQSARGVRTVQAEADAARLRADAARLRAQVDPQELQTVAAAAQEANAIIDQRAFSWTDLLTEFEATLPPDVRITAIQPRLDGDRFVLSVGVQARRSEDLDEFIEALEERGAFYDVLSVQEQTNPEGLIQAVVEGAYVPPARSPAEAPGQ